MPRLHSEFPSTLRSQPVLRGAEGIFRLPQTVRLMRSVRNVANPVELHISGKLREAGSPAIAMPFFHGPHRCNRGLAFCIIYGYLPDFESEAIKIMWARTQLKIGWRDLASGALYCALPGNRAAAARELEGFWGDGAGTMTAFSVRSGFDLMLQALDPEPGDEIVFSALNVRGMIKIVRRLGLTPVPVDLAVAHMAPRLDLLEAAITKRTKMIVVAHLFGTHVDLDPVIEVAERRNVMFVEDCAQVFDGQGYAGHPDADVCMFSFGPLKTATALGGALMRVRDGVLLSRMRDIQAGYPVQKNAGQLKRVVQFAGLKLVTSRLAMRQIYKFFHKRGMDYEDSVSDKVREVAPLGSSKKLRIQPSLGMLRLMRRRIRSHRQADLEVRAEQGRRLRDLLGDSVVLPAQSNAVHTYWVFPILVDKPRVFIDRLREKGFDCADLPRSQAVQEPEDRPDLKPKVAARTLADLVVVPCYPGMPISEIEREAEAIREVAAEVGSTRTRQYSRDGGASSADAA